MGRDSMAVGNTPPPVTLLKFTPSPAATPLTAFDRPQANVPTAPVAIPLDQVSKSLVRKTPGGPSMDVAAMDLWLDNKIPAKNIEGNSMETLLDTDYVKALIEEIDKAQTSIAIVTHTFSDAEVPTQITDKLIAKAKAGVEVVFVMDWFGGTRNGEPKNLQRLRDGGVKVEVMEDKVLAKRMFESTHSKVSVFDGKVGFVGGHNLSGGGLTKHDVTMRIRGPILQDVQTHLQAIWQRAGGGKITLAPVDLSKAGTVTIRALDTDPKHHHFRTAALKAIDSAKRFINVEQVYFTDKEFAARLMSAAKRGVRVRMVVPTETDEAMVQAIHRTNFPTWLAAGIEIHQYDKPIHTKAFSVDGVWATVGSTNFTTRGQEVNYEMSLAFTDPKAVKDLDDRMFAYDRSVSRPMTMPMAHAMQGGVKTHVLDYLKNRFVRPHL